MKHRVVTVYQIRNYRGATKNIGLEKSFSVYQESSSSSTEYRVGQKRTCLSVDNLAAVSGKKRDKLCQKF